METATLGDKVLRDFVFGYGFNNDGDKLINLEYEVTSTSSMVDMAQEKAQEDDQDDAEGEEKRKFVPHRNVVNFFFTNFPSKWNTANLLELFEEVGESKKGCNKVDWCWDLRFDDYKTKYAEMKKDETTRT
ncbi:hypothetical protein Tco_1422816 [Tanacetum coccineum]